MEMEKVLYIKTCVHDFCGNKIEITERDLAFYKKMGVPEPVMCFPCRLQRRMAFRNERRLYHNTCGLCEKNIISIYSPERGYPVYCTTCWWGDGWDPMDYGREFDFSRPFFEQFKELWDSVPKLQLVVLGDNINSDYTHDAYKLVNCYLVFDAEQCLDSYYGETCDHLKDCCDSLCLKNAELCYECVNCKDCYNLDFSRYCNNCSDSKFLLNCKGCRNCFGCANLQNKQYYIFNKPHTSKEYERIVAQYGLDSFQNLQKFKKDIEEFYKQFPQKNLHGVMNENVTGENLNMCKDTFESYDCDGLRDCKYCVNMLMGANDCYDIEIWGKNLELSYNGTGVGDGSRNVIASYYACMSADNVYHSIYCMNNNSNLFGCVGLHQKKFCIMNKQYEEKQWHEMFTKIKNHMTRTGEWAEFFPPMLSAFGYNETVANEYFPLSKELALERGFKWKEEDERQFHDATCVLPDSTCDVTDGILKEVLKCTACGKNYKLIAQELAFHRKKCIPLPRKCYDCRYTDRLKLRNPRKLWGRKCDKCSIEMQTSYAPRQGGEKVYCEKCYLREVY